MPLHLIRLPIDLAALARVVGDRGWTRGRRNAFDEGAALHHLLGETIGPGVLQPFRLLAPPRGRSGNLYAYSGKPADELTETARQVALPETLTALAIDRAEGKEMPDRWYVGQRLGFDLRLRPVVRLASDIPAPDDRRGGRAHGFRKGSEVDAFLAVALREHPNRVGTAAGERSRDSVYLDWLAKRLSPAADVESARVIRIRRTLAARHGGASEGPDAVFHGVLSVLDPETFADRLSRGVGRHRAYGYGMLLLRPPGALAPRR